MKIFKNRKSAGKLLAKRLKHYRNSRDIVVLGIPRGGVVVAKEVADQLNLPLNIVITRKIAAPNQTELALGAVDGDGIVVWEESLLQELRIKPWQLREEVERQTEEIKRRERVYGQEKVPLDIKDKTVILVDDGIATGATILSAIFYLKRHGVGKLVVAVPLSSQDMVNKISREVDQLVVLHSPKGFHAVGQFYKEFNPISDEEVIQLWNNE